MNKLRTVQGTVLEHQIKNIVGTAQGQSFDLNPDNFLKSEIVLS